MTSKRKLEEKIAETKDPVIRKQLQELLNVRSKRSEKRKKSVGNVIKKIKNYECSEEQGKRNTEIVKAITIVLWLYVIANVLFLIWLFTKGY